MSELKVLKAYYHKHEAQMAQGLLKDSGIESILQADDCGGFRPHITLSMGNNRLLVKESDFDKAKEILEGLEKKVDEAELLEEFHKANEKKSDIDKSGKSGNDWKIWVQLLIGILLILDLFYLPSNLQANLVWYDSLYNEPFATLFFLMSWPVDFLLLFLYINILRFKDKARVFLVYLSFIFIVLGVFSMIVPPEVIWKKLDLAYEYGSDRIAYTIYLLIDLATVVFFTRSNVKKLFKV